MWKIFQKEALGILRYTSRIDFLKIPDHVVLSEFTEIKVTLKMNSVEVVGRRLKVEPSLVFHPVAFRTSSMDHLRSSRPEGVFRHFPSPKSFLQSNEDPKPSRFCTQRRRVSAFGKAYYGA